MFEYNEEVYNTRSAEEILPYLNETFNPKSVIDVGCGNGTWLKAFSKFENVKELTGIDNSDKSNLVIPEEWFHSIDLTRPFNLNKKADLLLCLEVAEHLDEASAETFIKSLCNHSDVIIFSAAIPAQVGVNHVNEQWPEYWRELFAKQNFEAYDILRKRFWVNENIKYWYRQNMFLYARSGSISHMNFTPDNILHSYIHPELYLEKENERLYIHEFWNKKLSNPGVKSSFKQLIKAVKKKSGL